MKQANSKQQLDIDAVQRMLMDEVKNQSAQMLSGSLQLELHFLHGQIVKVRATQQRYMKD